MPSSLVICDLDGTLADSVPGFRRNVNSVGDRFGFRRIQDADLSAAAHWSANVFVVLGGPLEGSAITSLRPETSPAVSPDRPAFPASDSGRCWRSFRSRRADKASGTLAAPCPRARPR